MSGEYVALTGSKNNAGDYLIKRRAFDLMAALRPDRHLHDLDGWKPLTDASLARINKSKALLLLGGPALHREMYPKVYPLVPDLERITVPVIGMGLGWQHRRGTWDDAARFEYSDSTRQLLDKMQSCGHVTSVRDFSTLRTLEGTGLRNVLMTGCPATYAPGGAPEFDWRFPRRVAFSLGVGFVHSRSLLAQTRELVLRCREYFADAEFEVSFHHSLDPDRFLAVYPSWKRHLDAHTEMASWLASHGVAYRDISGGAQNLMDFYSDMDLHVGYRVHAHIFMASLSRPSLLIAEDARGRALKDTLGGMVIHASERASGSRLAWWASRRLPFVDAVRADADSWRDVRQLLDYEAQSRGQRSKVVRSTLTTNLEVMKRFLAQLP